MVYNIAMNNYRSDCGNYMELSYFGIGFADVFSFQRHLNTVVSLLIAQLQYKNEIHYYTYIIFIIIIVCICIF